MFESPSDIRRFSNFRGKLEEYTRKRFNFPFITKSVFRASSRLLNNPTDPKAAKRLREAIKVWRPMARFLVRARQQQKAKELKLGINTEHTELAFKDEIQSLLKLLQQMMHISEPAFIIGTQTLALQHFSSLLPELAPIFTPHELLDIAVAFIDSCREPKSKMVLHKLQLISNLVRSQVFASNPRVQRLLVANLPRWLKPHCGKPAEALILGTPDPDNAKLLWREQIRLSTAIVAFALDYLWAFIVGNEGDDESRSRGAEGFALLQPLMSDLQQSYLWIKEQNRPGPKTVISPLFPTSYPFPSKPILGSDKSLDGLDELLAEISAVLMTSAIRSKYGKVAGLFGFRPTTYALAPMLLQSFDVYTSILSSDAFPSVWLNSHILVHKAIINHLATISEVLVQFYNPEPEEAESFDTNLWLAFFNLLLKTAGSEALAVEHLPPQKRRAVWRIAGDLRKKGAKVLQESWAAIGWPTAEQETKGFQIERMGGYQVQYVPSLVAPVVRLSLSHHEALRNAALEVLQTMIVSEFVLNEDLCILQNEIVNVWYSLQY
jgi:dedicator of cytokinesis protein 3